MDGQGGGVSDENPARVAAQGSPLPVGDLETPATAGKGSSGTAKRGRPSKAEKTAAAVGELVDGTFGTLALILGDHWALEPAERDKLARPICDILEAQGGGLLESVVEKSPYAALGLGLVTIAGPRVIVSRALAREKREQNKLLELYGGGDIGRGAGLPDSAGSEGAGGGGPSGAPGDAIPTAVPQELAAVIRPGI